MSSTIEPMDWQDDEFPEDDFEIRLEEAMEDCGWVPHLGICMWAGSEQCDWECGMMQLTGKRPDEEDKT